MVYYGTQHSERIGFHAIADHENVHFIELTKSADEPTFIVTCCCKPGWYYEFMMENNSDYERIKLMVMDTMFNADDIDEMIDELSEIFEDGFSEILVDHSCNCEDNDMMD